MQAGDTEKQRQHRSRTTLARDHRLALMALAKAERDADSS